MIIYIYVYIVQDESFFKSSSHIIILINRIRGKYCASADKVFTR